MILFFWFILGAVSGAWAGLKWPMLQMSQYEYVTRHDEDGYPYEYVIDNNGWFSSE
jgi:hypothetical protein